ncbi:FHA domain-containing protein, partial [Myxococcota bacterium]
AGTYPYDLVVATSVRILGGQDHAETTSTLSSLVVQQQIIGYFVFPLIAGLVGLFIGAADGLLSRAYRRAGLCGLVGLGVGLGFGLIASLAGNLVYGVGVAFAQSLDTAPVGQMSTVAFVAQMVVRGIAWSLTGAAMGLGQGIALRSKKLLINGLLGGMVGALIGGLLFDPVDYLVHGGTLARGGAEASRAVGFVLIGASAGLMIGIVELIAREAWVKMLTGPLVGKEFVLYKNPTTIGSSPKADIYLFKDPDVEPTHALVHTVGESYEIEDKKSAAGTFVDGHRASRRRLTNGCQIRIGKTVLSFSVKET